MSDIPERVPVPGRPGQNGVNQPDSPYGDVAQLDRLKQSLGPPGGGRGTMPPPDQGPAPVEQTVPPAGNPQGAPGESPVPGLPRGLFRETDNPSISVADAPAPIPAQPGQNYSAAQSRLRIIDALTQSDNPRVREWAEMVRELLIQGG